MAMPRLLVATMAAAFASGAPGDSGLPGGLLGALGAGPFMMDYGPMAGALLLQREDLVRVRSSLGRVSEELHVILGIIDQHLESPPVPLSTQAPMEEEAPATPSSSSWAPAAGEAPGSGTARVPEGDVSPVDWFEWFWFAASCAWRFGIFAFDVSIVVGMQMFLGSVGGHRGGASVMSKQQADALALKEGAAGGGLPTPTATPPPSSSQRLSVLSQEEFLAAVLSEHSGKLTAGVSLAALCRVLENLLSTDGVALHLVANLAVMLRCMSVVMFMIRDEVTLPKEDKKHAGAGPPGGR